MVVAYQCKAKRLSGTSYGELIKQARRIFHGIEKHTKRRPYLRSAYFEREKIFFDIFWDHLNQKRLPDRVRRLKFFACAVELLQNSRLEPKVITNPQDKSSHFYRFTGITNQGEIFYVQVKENLKLKQKQLASVLPAK